MTAWWMALHFLRPDWLWALLAVPLLWPAWRLRQRRQDAWQGWVDPHLLPALRVPGRGAAAWRLLWPALACVIAVLALAGPSWRPQPQPLWRSATPLVIALDLSSATAATDLPPSRLLQARAKIAGLLRQRTNGQVALVAYADDAFTVAPLTDDAANVALFLDALAPEVMPIDGQRGDRAIAWSQQLLHQSGFEQGEILLLTDHADDAARAAAAQAHARGYRVSVLGLGTAAGAAYRTREGGIARANLDPGSLRALANAGGGRYAAMALGDDDLHALGVLAADGSDAQSVPGETALAWQDDGYWLLPLLMLLALFAFRRGAVLAVLCGCLLLPLAPSVEAAENGWWQRADQQQQARIEQGVAAYRKGDYARAQQSFDGIDSDQGWYNLGNALAKQGQYDAAIAAYDRALQRHPGMADAIANRAAVAAARKRQPPRQNKPDGPQKQPGSGNRQGDAPQSGQSKDAANPPSSAADQPQKSPSPAADARQPPSSAMEAHKPMAKPGSGQQGDASAKPEDRQSQQQADAAQREKMQRALQQAQAGRPGSEKSPAAVAAETAEQREKRQAVEGWLRRVQDDPGGLLRARFQLEQQRRQREGK